MSDYADNLRKSMINKTRRFMRMVNEMQEKDDAALREQVIRMARETGWPDSLVAPIINAKLAEFAALVAAAEREAILQMSRDQWFKTQADFEEAIRARGQG